MMRSSAISRGLCLVLLATAARAQTVAAGARAVVNSDTLPVYNSMSTSSAVKATLTRGDAVTIGLVLFGDDVTWCAISKTGDNKRLGYASCEFLEQERPATAAPPPEQPKPKPITIREVPREPITITIPEPPAISAPAAPPAPALLEPKPTPVMPPEPAAAAPPPSVEPPAPAVEPPPPAVETLAPSVETPPPPAAPLPAPVEPARATDNEFVDAALDGSGLRSSLANYAENTHLLSFLDKGRLAEINIPQLDHIISKQFQPAVFYTVIGDQLRKSYSPERLPVLEWLRSPLTSKMADLERKALQPESHDQLVAFAASLTKSPPAESRLLLVHRLYDAMKTCDMEVETTISLVQAVALSIGPVLPKEKRYSAVELGQALGTVKSRYLSIMKNARLVRYLFAYQTLSDAEFEEHINFLESENGKWFVSQVETGFSEAGQAISRALGSEIPRNLKPKRP
jgi:hypothetical protein